jgi:hypothetical protein
MITRLTEITRQIYSRSSTEATSGSYSLTKFAGNETNRRLAMPKSPA